MAAALPEATLPNGKKVFCIQKYEVPVVYRQVQAYFTCGVKIHPGDTIFDIGANIGLFTLLAWEKCGPGGVIYAFEPIPPIFKALSLNAQRYHTENIKPLPHGLSRQKGTMPFTYYPGITVASTAYPANWTEELTDLFVHAPDQLPWFARWLGWLPLPWRAIMIKTGMRKFAQAETIICSVVTVSHMLRKYQIKQIDLLKLDAEKSELDILMGIESQDWPKIKQVVVEIHNTDNRCENVVALLERHGFSQINIVSEFGQKHSNLLNLYATR